nr:MAG TPA: hypothetical protein [Caudoviricetes sp.]
MQHGDYIKSNTLPSGLLGKRECFEPGIVMHSMTICLI